MRRREMTIGPVTLTLGGGLVGVDAHYWSISFFTDPHSRLRFARTAAGHPFCGGYRHWPSKRYEILSLVAWLGRFEVTRWAGRAR